MSTSIRPEARRRGRQALKLLVPGDVRPRNGVLEKRKVLCKRPKVVDPARPADEFGDGIQSDSHGPILNWVNDLCRPALGDKNIG